MIETHSNKNSFSRKMLLFKVTGYIISTITLIISLYSLKEPKYIPGKDLTESSISILHTGLVQNQAALVGALSGFAIFLLIEMCGSLLESKAREEDQINLHRDIKNIVEASAHIKYVGPSNLINPIIREAVSRATHISNTFMNMGEFSKLDDKIEKQIVSVYEMFLKDRSGNQWTDIVSANEVHDFRHKKIFEYGYSDFGIHEIYLLRSNMPIINYVILRNPSLGYKEVFFGWINDSSSMISQIYRSTHSGIVDMFQRQFDAMKDGKRHEKWVQNYSMPASERRPHNGHMVDKKGLWATKLYDLSGSFRSNGLIQIKFEDGKAIIRGLLQKGGNLQEVRHYKNVTVDGSKIYFDYTESRGVNEGKGLCEYNFFINFSIECINGYIYEHPAEGSGRIFGVRVDEEFDFDKRDISKFNTLARKYAAIIEKVK
ncbi:hypothetical protein WG908_03470 [Sphingobium sp. AN641]|uniref:hypothetical protein n=1 Tax=Sphingobium sp. AN641 TaxID=3133443 RepID=UPI0030C39BB1